MWPLLLTQWELREGPGNGLQGGKVIVLGSVQSLVAADITMCEHLLAGGTHTAVQAHLPGVGLPCILLVLLGFGARRPLSASEVPVRRQQLLLLGRVGQEHQQLVEDLLEALPEQVPAALVILGCGDHALSELPRVVLELAEASLVTLQEVLDGLDELQVPLPEILRDQVGLWRWCQPGCFCGRGSAGDTGWVGAGQEAGKAGGWLTDRRRYQTWRRWGWSALQEYHSAEACGGSTP